MVMVRERIVVNIGTEDCDTRGTDWIMSNQTDVKRCTDRVMIYENGSSLEDCDKRKKKRKEAQTGYGLFED